MEGVGNPGLDRVNVYTIPLWCDPQVCGLASGMATGRYLDSGVMQGTVNPDPVSDNLISCTIKDKVCSGQPIQNNCPLCR